MLEPFVSLIFRGARFGPAEMPVEALPEVAAYRDLVVAVARDIYLSENPGRLRIPKGFDASFELRMTGVTEGSAVPTIQRVRTDVLPRALPRGSGQVPMFGYEADFFDAARDLVEKAIAAAAEDKPLPTALRRETLARFNAFGRTLDDDDVIVVAQPNQKAGARYDKAVRKKLLLKAAATFEEKTEIVGLFRMADLDTNGFALRTPDGEKIPVTCPPLFVQLATTSFYEGAEVRVRGVGLYNAEHKLLRITSALDVSLAEDEGPIAASCAISVADQVVSLRSLTAGWYDGDGSAYDAAALDWFQALMTGLATGFDLATPFIYPTPEGHVSVEWSGREWDIALDFDLTTKVVDALAVPTRTESTKEATFALATPGGESALGRFIAEHLRKR